MSRGFSIALPAGYRRNEFLDFYSRDALSVSERVRSDGLEKCALLGGKPSLIEIRFDGDTALCGTDSDEPAEARTVAARMLGIDSRAAEFEAAFAGDSLLGPLIERQRGLRIPLTPDPWEALAWAIMGQQISLAVATMLRRNLIAALGERHGSGLRAHPPATSLAEQDPEKLRDLRFSKSKAEYLVAAARAVASGELPLGEMAEMSVEAAAAMAARVRGIGPWTIQYFFLRGLGMSDCLPAGDAGLAQGLARILGERPSEKAIRDLFARYAPWRSLATYHVWASLKDPKA